MTCRQYIHHSCIRGGWYACLSGILTKTIKSENVSLLKHLLRLHHSYGCNQRSSLHWINWASSFLWRRIQHRRFIRICGGCLFVPLLSLEEDDSWEVELAGERKGCFKMSSFHYYLWRMYFVSLFCVSKRMTAERLNRQGRANGGFIFTFGGCILSSFPCLEEHDGRVLKCKSCFKMSSFHYYLWRMYFVFLFCVSKSMTAERLNWKWEQRLF